MQRQSHLGGKLHKSTGIVLLCKAANKAHCRIAVEIPTRSELGPRDLHKGHLVNSRSSCGFFNDLLGCCKGLRLLAATVGFCLKSCGDPGQK